MAQNNTIDSLESSLTHNDHLRNNHRLHPHVVYLYNTIYTKASPFIHPSLKGQLVGFLGL